MAGHMGCAKVTLRNVEIMKVDTKNNIFMVKGSVPGADGGLVTIAKMGGKK